MKDNSSERSRSHRVVGGGEDLFSQSDRSISLEGQLLQLHLFPSSREVHKRHIESSWDNLNSPSLSCLIAHFPGDSYYFTSGEIHKRTTVRSTKTKSFVSKMDKAQKRRCKVSKINTAHEIQPPRPYLDFYENHCQLFVVCRLTWLCMRNLVSKSSDQHKK